MRLQFTILLCVLGALMSAPPARADGIAGFPCGDLGVSNESYHFGTSTWIQYNVSTSGALDICGQWFVTSIADVAGVSGSGHGVSGLLYADARRAVPTPRDNESYVVNGTHIGTTVLIFQIYRYTTSSVQVPTIKAEAEPERSPYCATDPAWDATCSPLLIDVRGNGFQLTAAKHGVYFDLDADGVPERVGWTRAGSDDAWLVLDRNANGTIDDGTELFGSQTPLPNTTATGANGFEALKFAEAFSGGPVDTVLNASDPVFAHLQLWRDVNHDGFSQPGELQTLIEAGLTSIETDYQEITKRAKTNTIRQVSTVGWEHGRTRVVDVWLEVVR